MCGIFCTFLSSCKTNQEIDLPDIYETCKSHIIHRGPDFNSSITFNTDNYEILFAASVLWLQGSNLTQQPIETDNSVFVYNGDIFGGNLVPDEVRHEQGDTLSLLNCLVASENIVETLLLVQGPYAFIYLDKQTMKLYFTRDKFGRRSLIIGSSSSAIVLASVFPKTVGFECLELPALGVFCYDLNSDCLYLYPWPFKHCNFNAKLAEVELLLKKTIIVNETTAMIPRKRFVDPSEFDLYCFKELQVKPFQTLLQNNDWLNNVVTLNNLLEQAVNERISTQPSHCQDCIQNRISCNHTTTGVLFSGGIDCAILALLADKFIDTNRPIDLLNVAFSPDAPDRITGKSTFFELKELRPNRNWNFIEINVTQDDLESSRSSCIKHLIYPLNSILDDSLGCALWFASRGSNETYRSPCRVLLVGMGADELFGGYTKHRAAFKRGGWLELNRLLEDDWQNISHRNLARDDRVVSDHSRQLRTPYLDENVVDFVQGLNCWERTYPSENLPQGVGEKILLRSLGYYLGLVNAAGLKKRALQFGSRIANSKENANDISPRL